MQRKTSASAHVKKYKALKHVPCFFKYKPYIFSHLYITDVQYLAKTILHPVNMQEYPTLLQIYAHRGG